MLILNLRNNASNIYFSIEGQNDTALFDSVTFTSLVNCSVTTGSKNAAFTIAGPATASFTLNTGGSTIVKDNIKFRATNTLSLLTRRIRIHNKFIFWDLT